MGESWEKPAAELSFPTPCDSTYNQDLLTEDITATVLKQQKAALLCEEKKLFTLELFRQRLSSVENTVSNTKPTYSNNKKKLLEKILPFSLLPTNYHRGTQNLVSLVKVPKNTRKNTEFLCKQNNHKYNKHFNNLQSLF